MRRRQRTRPRSGRAAGRRWAGAAAGIFVLLVLGTRGAPGAGASASVPGGAVSALMVELTGPPEPFVPGQSGQFVANVSGGDPPYSTSWEFGDGTSSSAGPLTTHAYQNDGEFLVELTVQDAAGSRATTVTQVMVQNTTFPLSPIAAATPAVAAVGESVQFNVTYVPGTPVAYNWSFGDGTWDRSTSPTHGFAAPGAYDVALHLEFLSNFSGQWSNTPSWNVTYLVSVLVPSGEAPVVMLSSSPPSNVSASCSSESWTVIYTAQAAGGAPPLEYRWQWGDGTATVGGPSMSHTYGSPPVPLGPVVVTVTDANGSTSSATGAVPEPVVPLAAPGTIYNGPSCGCGCFCACYEPPSYPLPVLTVFLIFTTVAVAGVGAAVAVQLARRRR